MFMSRETGGHMRLKVIEAALQYYSGKSLVNGVEIAYVKVGRGRHVVLLLPGALGSAVTDFSPQLDGLDRNEFTIIAWDPRGYGRSIPPERDFPVNVFYRDADDAAKLMENLGFAKYSLVGWSDGGNTAAILASKYPERVEKLIIWGAGGFVTQGEVEAYKEYSDISSWSEKMRKPMIEMYGERLFHKMWKEWNDGYKKIFEECNGDIYTKQLKYIVAPTLILHGMKDPIVPLFHAEFLHKNIKGSTLDCWPEGKHNIHLRFPAEFNAEISQFILKD